MLVESDVFSVSGSHPLLTLFTETVSFVARLNLRPFAAEEEKEDDDGIIRSDW